MPAPPSAATGRQQKADKPGTTYEDVGQGSVSGNITRDPELRYTPDGRAVVTLRVAETERVKDDQEGRWTDGETSYWDVIVWGDQGERCAEDLSKGDRIAAVGNWQKQSWTDDQEQPRSKTVLVARDVGPSLLFRRARIDRKPRAGGRP